VSEARVLIAGIGNIFFGDDAFGCEVARRLAARALPPGVRAVDFGIRGMDLAFALMDEPDATVLVDAVQRGAAPGTLYLIEPELAPSAPPHRPDGHGLDPAAVLRMVRGLGGRTGRVLLVGCEPVSVDEDPDGRIGLSPPVEMAVEPAIRMIESLLVDFPSEGRELGWCTSYPS
jgi:hydrogenase maturation protease